ncbi:MAG: hypothetical protein ACOX0L_08545 [Natronincolaceae bacterium]|jgi:hypothetical protein|nr:hypothetical protein [Bacillota bacterium]
MVQMWIDIIFLGLVLMPIFILFAALYQNLLEIPRAEQKVRQKEIRAQPYYTESGEISPVKLRVVK